MTATGFWTGGPNEHRRAVEQHIRGLRKRLQDCKPEDREQIAKEIEDVEKELHRSDDDQILW